MKRLARVLVGLGIVLLAIVVILAAAGIWFVRRPWPQVKGTIAVNGLQAPVEVIRDQWGVPHIYAENELDLFFAQGYVHAQDRLWQMEFNRRVGSGTLSAALGESTLDIDRFMRTLGLRRAATRDWTQVDDDTSAILQAYADGVNAYIASHRGRLPLEFVILGVDPDPWTPVDTLLWGKVMAYSLSSSYGSELLRATMIAELGVEATQQLMPPYPGQGPFIVPPEVHNYAWLQGVRLDNFDGARMSGVADPVKPNPSQGSNNWVVHGSRTSTGMPLLADDTHLSLDMPSIWYENGLHGGRFDAVGFSFPGVPMVIIGHNSRIAWGVTNLPADVQDLYVERLNSPDQPTQYEFQGEWRDLEIVQERIEVAGGEPVVLDVLITHHGPILNNVVGSLQDAEPMALRWTALDSSILFRAVVLLDLAGNWDEFRQALSFWDVPSQNFVYADVEGNIGYQTPGKIPIRPQGKSGLSAGPIPVPGWTGEYEWQGFIPFDELPSVLNPVTGFVATANNKVVPDEYPYYLAYDWSAPYRAQRITDLLAADDSVTPEDMQDIHAQTYSLPAELLRPYLLAADTALGPAVTPDDDLQARALELVDAWDLYCEADSAGAAIYQTWYWFLVENTLRDELGDDLMDDYLGNPDRHVPVMIELMDQADSPWFDDVDTPAVETRDDIVRRSLADAVAWLGERYGQDPEKWEWGELHTKTFVHQPLGQSGIGLLENLFNSKSVPARGDEFTVDAAWFSYTEPFAMTGGASQRFVADLSDLDNSRTIQTTGQSGQLFHRHREDFTPLWQNVEYHPSPFSREAVESYADTVLTLTPSEADE